MTVETTGSIRQPIILDRPRLWSFDYDGTMALTSEKIPGGHDVNDAYAIGIEKHIGPEAAEEFRERGHQHSTPADIVSAFIEPSDPKFRSVVRAVTESKLDVLSAQIGQRLPDGARWPRPTEGFREFWEKLQLIKKLGANIGTAIVSAGHTEFEQRTFDMWGVPQPDMYLTDDVVTAMALNLPHELQVKPSPMLVEQAQHLWAYKLRQEQKASAYDRVLRVPKLMETVHFGDAGDTPVKAGKDQQLARNVGAEFVLIDPDAQGESWNNAAVKLGLGSLALESAMQDGQ